MQDDIKCMQTYALNVMHHGSFPAVEEEVKDHVEKAKSDVVDEVVSDHKAFSLLKTKL